LTLSQDGVMDIVNYLKVKTKLLSEGVFFAKYITRNENVVSITKECFMSSYCFSNAGCFQLRFLRVASLCPTLAHDAGFLC